MDSLRSAPDQSYVTVLAPCFGCGPGSSAATRGGLAATDITGTMTFGTLQTAAPVPVAPGPLSAGGFAGQCLAGARGPGFKFA